MVSFGAIDTAPGDAIRGKEHLGRPQPPMGESAISARGVTWLSGGFSSGP